jgi:hypothetical protein
MKIQLANNRENDISGSSYFFPRDLYMNTNYRSKQHKLSIAHFKYAGVQNYQLHTLNTYIYINWYVEK